MEEAERERDFEVERDFEEVPCEVPRPAEEEPAEERPREVEPAEERPREVERVFEVEPPCEVLRLLEVEALRDLEVETPREVELQDFEEVPCEVPRPAEEEPARERVREVERDFEEPDDDCLRAMSVTVPTAYRALCGRSIGDKGLEDISALGVRGELVE